MPASSALGSKWDGRKGATWPCTARVQYLICTEVSARVNAILSLQPGVSHPISKYFYSFHALTAMHKSMTLPQNGVWNTMYALYHTQSTIQAPSLLLCNSMHFSPSFWPYHSPVPFFPLYHFLPFDIRFVKQKLGTIKYYFSLLCECVVWHIGCSGWVHPHYQQQVCLQVEWK